ncbi:MAG: glycine cleavage T C-terminal barrel domain-containing protein [Methylocystis sp.]
MAGLAFAVKMNSGVAFQGREALVQSAGAPLPRLLAGFVVDDPDITLLGRETIFRNGARVGWLSSGGYGYSIGKAIGYGYVRNPDGVDPTFVLSGEYQLEIAGERRPASVSLSPFYDPKGQRIRT